MILIRTTQSGILITVPVSALPRAKSRALTKQARQKLIVQTIQPQRVILEKDRQEKKVKKVLTG